MPFPSVEHLEMKTPVASLLALKNDGDVDDSVLPLPVYEGLNTYGRNDCSLFNKQISREHLRLDAWPGCGRFDVYVVGPNPILVSSNGKKEKLGSQEWTTIHLSDVIFFLPNEFPFRIDNVPPEIVTEAACDVTTPLQMNKVDVESLVSTSSCDQTELTRKRERQLLEDKAIARNLQEKENMNFAKSLEQSMEMRFPEVNDRSEYKLRKTDIASNSSATTFRLLRTIGLPRSANIGCVRIEDVIEAVQLLYEVEASDWIDTWFESWVLCCLLRRVSLGLEYLAHCTGLVNYFLNQHLDGGRQQYMGYCDMESLPPEGDILFAILSNYMLDLTWLLPACPVLNVVPVVMIHGESGGSLELLKHSKPSQWVFYKPPLPISYGTHHSKAMLLVYRTGVRVVVHTANLISADWNNKTQGLWMQDFPLKEACKQKGFRTNPGGLKTESEFEAELLDYLRHLDWKGCTMDLPDFGETRVDAGFFKMFDYRTATVRLVASVPGYHSGSNLHKYGHMKLRSVLAQLEFNEEFERSSLVFQFSSLGSLDEKWIAELTTSMSAGRSVTKRPLGEGKVQFVWPTVEDIRCSLEGYAAGGSVPSPQKNMKPFLSKYWSKWCAGHVNRSRAMPHIKTYLRYKDQSLAWFLLTSSNLSKAAWGALQKNSTQLMIRSYELGVLFLPSCVLKASGETFSCTGNSHGSDLARGRLATSISEASVESRESHAKLVTTLWDDKGPAPSKSVVRLPVPYLLPPPQYEVQDVPWSWDRQYTQPDVHGERWP